MTEHRLFYYPYASLTNAQLPLLKVAALYFDKLVLLDPVAASWNTIGADAPARNAIASLVDAKLLEVISPASVLAEHDAAITAAIQRDLADSEFLALCDQESTRTGKTRWTLALSKVPEDLVTNERMRQMLGKGAQQAAARVAYVAEDYIEGAGAMAHLGGGRTVPAEIHDRATTFRGYADHGTAYDEMRDGYDGEIEYRYADYPLALGEAIMMNHALFGGLLRANATPITDDAFHSRVLAHKLARMTEEPEIRAAIEDRSARRALKAAGLAIEAFRDEQIELPILHPSIPLDEVLEHREKNKDALGKARQTLAAMARRIEAEPWSPDFAEQLETSAIPDVLDALKDAKKATDAWLQAKPKGWLVGAGAVVGIASAVLGVLAAPVTPIAIVIAGLGIAGGAAIPGGEWVLDWRAGKKTARENGLHYFLRV